jgi:long-chain acyl-CoA synthetase
MSGTAPRLDPALWRRRYQDGVPAEIDPDAARSLVELFDQAVARFADRPAYTSLGVTLSYADLERRSRAFAAWLQGAAGVGKGERVALVMPNVLAYPVALFGALRAGATVVGTNPLFTAREMADQLADSGAVVAVVLENMAATLAGALGSTDVRAVVVARVGDLMGAKGRLVNLVVKRVRRLVPPYRLPGAVTLARALAQGRARALEPVDVGPEDLAFLQYSGGTTGRAKGVMLTHRNLVANVEQCAAWFSPALRPGEETVLTALPLYHVFALTVNCLLMLRCGARNMLILNARDLPDLVGTLRGERVTVITGVNTLFAHLMATPGFADLDLSALRLTIAGGMATQRPVAERWKAITGTPLIEGYGLTEASPVTNCNRLDIEDFTGAVGYPLPSTEVAVRGPDGAERGVGEEGELCFRGPQVMRGYWRRPDETAAVLGADGFLASGDVGVMDEDGLVRVVDRLKDTIVVSGFTVYPNEVEEIAVGCPGVRECAVIGVPEGATGEAVVMYVVRDDPALTEEALLAHLRANLTRYKLPHRIEFRDELPKTPVGKVLRRALREEVLR